MKKFNVLNKYQPRHILVTLLAAVIVLVILGGLPQVALADKISLPPVPANLQPPQGAKVFLVGHATGTQNYICLPSGSGVAFALFTPQATLFDDDHEQIMTHFFSPNPEDDIIRATWLHSQDSSTVWAAVVPNGSSTDPAFVEPGAIPWLLLKKEHTQDGPTSGDKLSVTTYIQRLNTSGGVAPSTGCTSLTDIGNKAIVRYTTDYFFYKGGDN